MKILLHLYLFNTGKIIKARRGMGGLWELCCKGEIEDHANGERRKYGITDRAPDRRSRVKMSGLVRLGPEIIKALGIVGRHSVLLVV